MMSEIFLSDCLMGYLARSQEKRVKYVTKSTTSTDVKMLEKLTGQPKVKLYAHRVIQYR